MSAEHRVVDVVIVCLVRPDECRFVCVCVCVEK